MVLGGFRVPLGGWPVECELEEDGTVRLDTEPFALAILGDEEVLRKVADDPTGELQKASKTLRLTVLGGETEWQGLGEVLDAAAEGDAAAMYRLVRGPVTSLRWAEELERLAEAGDASALYHLALLVGQPSQDGSRFRHADACSLLSLAAAQGHRDAVSRIATLCGPLPERERAGLDDLARTVWQRLQTTSDLREPRPIAAYSPDVAPSGPSESAGSASVVAEKEPRPARRAAADPEGPIMVGGDVAKPVRISGDEPEYTEEARKARIQGVVILQLVIDAEGVVAGVKVLKGLPLGLSEAAVKAARTWRFEPATLRGKPIAVYWNVTSNFSLDE